MHRLEIGHVVGAKLGLGAAWAVQEGEDAALVQEPWGAVMESQGARLVVNEKGIWANGNYTTTVLVVNTAYAEKNPAALRGLLRSRTVQYLGLMSFSLYLVHEPVVVSLRLLTHSMSPWWVLVGAATSEKVRCLRIG